MSRTLVLLGALALPGCGELQYTRRLVDRPPASAAVELLVPGLELQQCFDLLGAPQRVDQLANDDPNTGFLCSWIWFRDAGYRLQVSAPLENGPSASVTYSNSALRVPALQLEFGPDFVLRRFERAYLPAGAVRAAPEPLGGPLGWLFD